MLRVSAIGNGLAAEGVAAELERVVEMRGITTEADEPEPEEEAAPAEAGADDVGGGGGGWGGRARGGAYAPRAKRDAPDLTTLRQLLDDLPDHLAELVFDHETQGTLPSSQSVHAIQEAWRDITVETAGSRSTNPPEPNRERAPLGGER